ncbi:hypothetical protein RFI_00317, partial [Reticulomyxa filosa]
MLWKIMSLFEVGTEISYSKWFNLYDQMYGFTWSYLPQFYAHISNEPAQLTLIAFDDFVTYYYYFFIFLYFLFFKKAYLQIVVLVAWLPLDELPEILYQLTNESSKKYEITQETTVKLLREILTNLFDKTEKLLRSKRALLPNHLKNAGLCITQ